MLDSSGADPWYNSTFYRFFGIFKFWGICSGFADFTNFNDFSNLGYSQVLTKIYNLKHVLESVK